MKIRDGCVPCRSALLETYIWYASYGSNMWRPRFLCYIEGGEVEGMSAPCCGSRDRSSPKDVAWKTVPHRLFFGRSFTRTWGPGGVAFLHPESNSSEKSHICMYKITLEQFNDLLFQENCLVKENCSIQQIESPLFNLSALDFVSENKSLHLEVLKDGWYSNVLYLGQEDDLPILTMTCALSDIDRFKSGEVPLIAPAKSYVNTLVKGLVEGKHLTEAAAIDYINDATVAPADLPVKSASSSAAEIVRSLQTLLTSSPKSDEGTEASADMYFWTQEHFSELLQLYDLGLPTLTRSMERSDRLSALLLSLLDRPDLPASKRQFAEAVSAQLSALLSRQHLIFAEQTLWNAHSSRVQWLKDQATAAAAPLIEFLEKKQALKDQASALRQQLAEARRKLSRVEDEKASLHSQDSLLCDKALSAQEQLSRIYQLHPVMKRRKRAAELAQANLQAEWDSLRHFLL